MNEDAFEAEIADSWEHLRHIAYLIDGEPGTERDLLSKALESFRSCTPDADRPGYAVQRLLESLIGNRARKQMSNSEIAQRLLGLVREIDPRPSLFGFDDEPEIAQPAA